MHDDLAFTRGQGKLKIVPEIIVSRSGCFSGNRLFGRTPAGKKMNHGRVAGAIIFIIGDDEMVLRIKNKITAGSGDNLSIISRSQIAVNAQGGGDCFAVTGIFDDFQITDKGIIVGDKDLALHLNISGDIGSDGDFAAHILR